MSPEENIVPLALENKDLKAEMIDAKDNKKHKYTARFVEYCKERYGNELNVADERSYCYNSLPICIVDCVYSLRARYNSVTVPIVERYANKFLNGDKTISDENDTLTDFIRNLTEFNLRNFADNIAKNHQILGGVPKEKVCLDIAEVLRELGIKTLRDFREYSSREELADAIKSVKGIGAAGVNYLFMLTGDDSKSKPDVHIHRCIAEACGEDVSDKECQRIIEKSAQILKAEYPSLTIRKLDGVIWRDFSSRKG